MPKDLLYKSRLFPEAIMFEIFRDHNVFDISKSATLHADEEIRILEDCTKKRKSDKSRVQLRRDEAKRLKEERITKKSEASNSLMMKADAARKHADAVMRQQELESIKTAHSLGLYSPAALKTWFDKHLAKTFAAGKDAAVIDLTSDEGDKTENSSSVTTSPGDPVHTINNTPQAKPERTKTNDILGACATLFGEEEVVQNHNNTNIQQIGKQKQPARAHDDREYTRLMGSYDVNTFGDARINTKVTQPTLTQGGIGYVVQHQGVVQEGRMNEAPGGDLPANEVMFLNGGVCCSQGHCNHPDDMRGMQCTVCLGMTHLECCTSMYDGSVQCAGCYALGGKPV